MRDNILHVKLFEGNGMHDAGELIQYNKGQRIQFIGEGLPFSYEVHFSNCEYGKSISVIGDASGVRVPDALLLTGESIWFWIYLHTGEDDGETVLRYRINVIRRAEITHEEPTPEELSEIEQIIVALNTAVAESETNVTHYPRVIDGMWHVWDADAEDFVSTGIEAHGDKGDKGDKGNKGDAGNGIRSTALNPDYTLTVTFTDGTSYTTPSIRGEKGDPGLESVMVATQVTGNQYRLGLERA